MAHEPQEAQAETPLTDRQSWAIIAMLVFCLLVIPGAILLGGTLSPLGLTWIDSLVALPMIPAVLFALVGVWTAVRR
ncbi:hypothetical protein [Salarchaeum japonicum]|uniref:hypothetical protein n=1 Tax=Salarchaeum japonicum TaxID=555573 RepID=UPI003C78A266